PTASAGLTPGKYWWTAALTAAGERITAGRGELIIEADLADLTPPYDGRSQAEIALSDAETALASFKASGGKIKRYTIGSRTMEFQAITDIMQVVSYWRIKVSNEQSRRQIAQGLGDPRKLFVRFGR
ncbi:MAG: hypothetical protein PHY45_02495, partial [Rhodocyclaceae bacterium]|nr:hypothetical protein [Rhodocyclaceae bacterium]